MFIWQGEYERGAGLLRGQELEEGPPLPEPCLRRHQVLSFIADFLNSLRVKSLV